MVKKAKKKSNSLEDGIEQTNDLLRKQLIIQLASFGTSHQTIRKIVGVEMKYVTNLLKPLKGKIGNYA